MPVSYQDDAERKQLERLFQLEKWRNDLREYLGDDLTDNDLDELLDRMLPALREEVSSNRKTLMNYAAAMIAMIRRGADWNYLVAYSKMVQSGEIKRRIFGE